MKKTLYSILAAAAIILGSFGTAHAISVFTSNQVGATPTNGYVLQTNGTNSTWVATSTLGISGGGSTNYWGRDAVNGLIYPATITDKVGIGTTSATLINTMFAVVGNDATTSITTASDATISITNANTTAGNNENIVLRMLDSLNAAITAAKIGAINVSHTAGAASADLYFATRNAGSLTEKVRLTAAGNLGIGTTTPPAPLTVVSPSTVNSAFRVMGNINGFLEGNVQNTSNAASASSDWVATSNNGDDTTHYVDLGINGSGGGGSPFTNANDAYVYSATDDLSLGALGATSSIKFFTTGTTVPVQRAVLTSLGKFGVGIANPSAFLGVQGTSTSISDPLVNIRDGNGNPVFNVNSDGDTTVVSSSSQAFNVFQGQGGTNPAFNIDASTPSSITGLNIKSAASGGGVTLTALGGTNENITVAAKGTGATKIVSGNSNYFVNVTATATTLQSTTHNFSPSGLTLSTASTVRFSVVNGGDGTLTAGAEAPHTYFNLGNSIRTHASNTAITLQRDFRISGTTHAFATAGGVITNLAAFSVDPGNAGTNGTATNNSAIYVPTTAVSNSTNAFGLLINAPTGATNNYAASTSGRIIFNAISAAASGNVTLCINATSKEIFEGGSGTSCAPSTETAKTDIATSTVGINELMALRPVTYFFNEGSETQQQIGLIAEEADTVDPRLVQKDPEGKIASIRWDNIAGLVLKSIQDIWTHDSEQDAQIAQLQAQIAQLQASCVMK